MQCSVCVMHLQGSRGLGLEAKAAEGGPCASWRPTHVCNVTQLPGPTTQRRPQRLELHESFSREMQEIIH